MNGDPILDGEDELVTALGQFERDRRAGEPSLASLEAMARGELVPDDAELAALMEPIAPSGRATMLDGLLSALDAPAPSDAGSDVASDAVAPVVSLEARRQNRTWIGVAVGLAAAAAIAFAVWPRATAPSGGRGDGGASSAGLPDYALEWASGDQALRGTKPNSVKIPGFSPESQVSLILRPSFAADRSALLAVRAWRAREDGALQLWDAPFQMAPGGAARLVGQADLLFPGPPALWTLVIAVGAADALPAAPPDVSAVHDRVRVLRTQLQTTP